jgi:hypothetical protein
MIRLPADGILYHGSYTEISRIDLSRCRSGLDFGRGFYLTSSFNQACSYVPAAVRKAKRRGWLHESYPERDGRVSVFSYMPDPNLFIHIFDDADEEWLHFTACNRNHDLFPELREKYRSVDIVGGKVADDITALTLNSYVSGAFGVPGTYRADHTAIDLLEPENLKDQFCFRTEESIRSLQFVRSERYGNTR